MLRRQSKGSSVAVALMWECPCSVFPNFAPLVDVKNCTTSKIDILVFTIDLQERKYVSIALKIGKSIDSKDFPMLKLAQAV